MVYWLQLNIMKWGPPAGIVAAGLLLGWIFKRFIHTRLVKAAEKSKWEGDDVILKALASQIIFWFFLAALSIAVRISNLQIRLVLTSRNY